MGTHPRVLSESFPMNTNMTDLGGVLQTLCPYALTNVALALEGLNKR